MVGQMGRQIKSDLGSSSPCVAEIYCDFCQFQVQPVNMYEFSVTFFHLEP